MNKPKVRIFYKRTEQTAKTSRLRKTNKGRGINEIRRLNSWQRTTGTTDGIRIWTRWEYCINAEPPDFPNWLRECSYSLGYTCSDIYGGRETMSPTYFETIPKKPWCHSTLKIITHPNNSHHTMASLDELKVSIGNITLSPAVSVSKKISKFPLTI